MVRCMCVINEHDYLLGRVCVCVPSVEPLSFALLNNNRHCVGIGIYPRLRFNHSHVHRNAIHVYVGECCVVCGFARALLWICVCVCLCWFDVHVLLLCVVI